MRIEDFGRSMATIAAWMAPAFAVWAVGDASIAFAFILSLCATAMVWKD